MNTRIHSYALHGIEARPVSIDVAIRSGIPSFTIIGIGDSQMRETRERVRSAFLNGGFELPARRVTVTVAPFTRRYATDGLALPIAVGILVASGQVPPIAADIALVGRLGLGGQVRASRGALAVAEAAKRDGREALIVPRSSMTEAAIVDGLSLRGVEWLEEIPAALAAGSRDDRGQTPEPIARPTETPSMNDVIGNDDAKRRLRLAVDDRRSVLLVGASGTGKTMLARRVVGLLPPITPSEAAEVTRIHSISGLHDDCGLVVQRPFRAPHHGTSRGGLVGYTSFGGLRVGEVTLAHRGVLLLDDVTRLDEHALEAVCAAVSAREVTDTQDGHAPPLPADALLIGTAAPCPCGFAAPRCRCNEAVRGSHEHRLERLGGMFDEVIVLPDPNAPDTSDETRR